MADTADGRMDRRRMLVLASGGLLASVAATAVPAQSIPAAGDLIPDLVGRWNVSFRVPSGTATTVWIVEPTTAGSTSVGTVGPNPVALSIREAWLKDGTLTLRGTTNMGDAILTARMDPARLEGRFQAGATSGTFVAAKRGDVRVHSVLEMFDQAVGLFEETLFTPLPFDAAWQARREELRSAMASAAATEREMVVAVRTLIAATGLSHNGYQIDEFSPPLAGASSVVTWRRLRGSIGYIKIASFTESLVDRADLDRAFAELAGTKGLVVDLQGNTGGNLGLALRLGDHLFDRSTETGRFASRKALNATQATTMDQLAPEAFAPFDDYAVTAFQDALDETGAVSLVTGGRAPHYAAPVALLIDGDSASTTEGMASVIKETGRARLFGVKSAGQMLSSRRLAALDGYTLRVAYADFRTPAGLVVEGVGVSPHQEVTGGGSRPLDAASAWLRGLSR